MQTLGRRDIIDLLEGIVTSGSPAASNSTQAALSKLFAWTVEEDVLQASPCLGVKKRVPLVRRDRVLSDDELRLIWLAAGEVGGPSGHLIRLLSLTGARLQEWGEARWSEIDLAERVFHLPADEVEERPRPRPAAEPAGRRGAGRGRQAADRGQRLGLLLRAGRNGALVAPSRASPRPRSAWTGSPTRSPAERR